MSNIFNTKRVQGFTLIELLVVIAIIGLLSTIIAAPIQNARKKARDSKKIAEIKAIQLAVEQYAESNLGNYPQTLPVLTPTYMPILPAAGFASSTGTGAQVAPRDKYSYVPYQATGASVQTGGAWFGYHLGAHLESYAQALDSDRDCVAASSDSDFVTATGSLQTCAFYPSSGASILGVYSPGNFITGMVPVTSNPTVSGWVSTSTDFSGADNATSTCNSLTDCVFDVTGQI